MHLLAISLVLFLSIVPYDLYFTKNAYLYPIIFLKEFDRLPIKILLERLHFFYNYRLPLKIFKGFLKMTRNAHKGQMKGKSKVRLSLTMIRDKIRNRIDNIRGWFWKTQPIRFFTITKRISPTLITNLWI